MSTVSLQKLVLLQDQTAGRQGLSGSFAITGLKNVRDVFHRKESSAYINQGSCYDSNHII